MVDGNHLVHLSFLGLRMVEGSLSGRPHLLQFSVVLVVLQRQFVHCVLLLQMLGLASLVELFKFLFAARPRLLQLVLQVRLVSKHDPICLPQVVVVIHEPLDVAVGLLQLGALISQQERLSLQVLQLLVWVASNCVPGEAGPHLGIHSHAQLHRATSLQGVPLTQRPLRRVRRSVGNGSARKWWRGRARDPSRSVKATASWSRVALTAASRREDPQG
mmetsp:Transcript_30660/g.54820  ORF Transcript_30660/g.54820 Transcript_30660/m.54820 type:complete len:217 (+) Transcript_30660:1608-2258(+)